MAPILGYWIIRGLGQHIKLLLEYTGEEYVEKRYEIGSAPDYKNDWFSKEKFNLGLDFPNLPYYIDGERKITQSNAILRYIARKHDLMGKTEDEIIKADMLENEAMDLRGGFSDMCYNKDYEKLKGPFIAETLPVKLAQLSKSLGDNDWFLGDKLGQHIKFLLEYTGEEYVEKQYEIGPAPEYSNDWFSKDKFSLGLDFPNLPYYIDGERKMTQSNAILRYIARKHDLMGKTEDEIIKADMLENEAMDIRMGFAKMCYNKDFETLKGPYIAETMPVKLENLSKFLGDHDWFLGDKISYVDFFLYEAIYALLLFVPSCLDKLENLKKFLDRFESLEPIKKYMNSDRYVKGPLNGPMAHFGAK